MENQTTAPQEQKNETAVKTVKKPQFKMDKRTTIIVLVAVAIIGIFLTCRSLFIAATVNGTPISRLSVIKELEKASGQQALDVLITQKLIETEVNKAGITVSQADVDAEIEMIEKQITAQGSTLKEALAQQNVAEDDFRTEILRQKKIEKLLADKLTVTDEEVTQYIGLSKTATPAGMSEDDFKNQIREQLKNQKFNKEAEKWITALKAQASISYYVDYGKPALEELPADAQ